MHNKYKIHTEIESLYLLKGILIILTLNRSLSLQIKNKCFIAMVRIIIQQSWIHDFQVQTRLLDHPI